MLVSPLLIAAWVLLATAVLRVMAVAGRADVLTERHWERLAALHTAGGVPFFPTRGARLELEVALADALRLERRRAAA